MKNNRSTFNIQRLLTLSLVGDSVFWLIVGILLLFFGYFDSYSSGQHLNFIQPSYLRLLWLHPILTGIYVYQKRQANKQLSGLSYTLLSSSFQPVSSNKSALLALLFRATSSLLILALAQPAFGSKKTKSMVNSMEIVITMDVSNSMNTKDIVSTMSRLEIAKRALHELVNNLHGEKIGICIFAGESFVQLPLTTDYNASKLFIDDITTDMISHQGTDILSAVNTSKEMFSDQETGKIILLVTDGENQETDPTESLEELQELKIDLCVLGLGTSNGGPIPLDPERPELGYKKTKSGRTVISKINPDLIKTLAKKANGTATLSTSEYPSLETIISKIKQAKHTRLEDLTFQVKENRYQIPLFAGLISWTLFLFVGTSKLTFFRKTHED